MKILIASWAVASLITFSSADKCISPLINANDKCLLFGRKLIVGGNCDNKQIFKKAKKLIIDSEGKLCNGARCLIRKQNKRGKIKVKFSKKTGKNGAYVIFDYDSNKNNLMVTAPDAIKFMYPVVDKKGTLSFKRDAIGTIKCSVENETTAAPTTQVPPPTTKAPTTAAPTTKIPPPTTAAPTTKAPIPNPLRLKYKNMVKKITTTAQWKIEFNLKIDAVHYSKPNDWFNIFIINDNRSNSGRPRFDVRIGNSSSSFYLNVCGCDTESSLKKANLFGYNVPFALKQWHKIIIETDANHNLIFNVDGIERARTNMADKNKHNDYCARAGDELQLWLANGFNTGDIAWNTFVGDFKYNGVAIH